MCEREVLPCFCLRAARTFEREFSLGISHQFLGGRPFAILSAVTRPTPLASASAASASVYASAACSALKVCGAPGWMNHSKCSIRTEYCGKERCGVSE